jgi:NADPH:quinone reductase-like Zn-dependent oxidoreductase
VKLKIVYPSMKSKPSVKSNDILVEVKAASINPIDYKMVEGHLKDMISLNLPSTIGFDVSGVVVEKGVDVNNFEIGDVYSRATRTNGYSRICKYQ